MTVTLTKAKPYAKAIFDLALKQNKLTEYFRTLKHLSEFVNALEKKQHLDGPQINAKQKMDLFSDLTNKSKEFENLIALLIKRKNLHLLPNIAKSFQQIFFEHKKVLETKIVSAKKLDGEQKKQLIDALKKRYQSKILLHCQIDETLVGGALIHIGDKVIDASIKGALLRLKQNLLSKNTYDKT